MFLSLSRHALAGLFASCVLVAPARARADAKQCVQQNNSGADLRDDHHALAAREQYRACVAEPECPAMVRAECDSALTDLKTSIPTLLVSVLDEQGHDVPGATLLVDGQSVALDGSALEVDPGTHELIAESGSLSSHLQVKAIEKDANRRIEIVLRAPKPAEPAKVAPPPVVLPKRSKMPAYVLGGVAAAGAASFGYFALSGHTGLGHLDQCKPYCTPDQVRSVRSKYLAADISLGVSLVALAGAGYWLFTTPKQAPPPDEKAFSWNVSAAPGLAALSLRWVE